MIDQSITVVLSITQCVHCDLKRASWQEDRIIVKKKESSEEDTDSRTHHIHNDRDRPWNSHFRSSNDGDGCEQLEYIPTLVGRIQNKDHVDNCSSVEHHNSRL